MKEQRVIFALNTVAEHGKKVNVGFSAKILLKTQDQI